MRPILGIVLVVEFEDGEVNGNQIVMMTRKVLQQTPDASLIHTPLDDVRGKFLLGLASSYLSNHLQVIPSLEGSPFLDPSERYSRVLATDCAWAGQFESVRDRQQVFEVLDSFTKRLRRAYRDVLGGMLKMEDLEGKP